MSNNYNYGKDDPLIKTLEPKRTNPKRPKKPLDNTLIGLLAGLLFPILGIVVLFFFWGNGNWSYYFKQFTEFGSPTSMEQSSKLISLSMIANLAPFYFFLNKKAYLSTRGIIIASFLFAILIFLYKFVWQ